MLGKNNLKKSVYWVLVAVGLGTVFIVGYRSNADGIRLRMDMLLTFARGVIDPVQAMPTANPALAGIPPAVYTRTPTATATSDSALSAETALPTATAGPPTATPAPTFTPTPPPAQARLEPPAYEAQDINNCGPATLAMLLRYYGWEGDQFTISDEIKPLRQDRNVNVEEMVAYSMTRAGWLETQYRVGGDLNLMRRLLASGFPVIIEEGFTMQESYWPNDDRWAGHYLLLTGYNDDTQTFTAHDSFVSPNRTISYADLDKNWKAFNRVYMLVYPPAQREQVQQILGTHWDRDANRDLAIELAKKEIEDDSTDSYAWFNLGTNLVYFERYSEAVKAYDTARALGLPQRMLRYQFGPFFAYFHTGRNDDLLALTEYALKRTPNAEEAMLWRGWAFYRQGQSVQAVDMFQKALEAHPTYPDAVYALNFVQAN